MIITIYHMVYYYGINYYSNTLLYITYSITHIPLRTRNRHVATSPRLKITSPLENNTWIIIL